MIYNFCSSDKIIFSLKFFQIQASREHHQPPQKTQKEIGEKAEKTLRKKTLRIHKQRARNGPISSELSVRHGETVCQKHIGPKMPFSETRHERNHQSHFTTIRETIEL